MKPVEDKREPSEARAIKGGEPRKRSSATLPASPTLARLPVFFPASPPLPTPLIPARLSFKPHSQEQNIPPKPSSLCPANPPAPEDRETETGVPIAQDIMVQNVPTATPHKPYSHKHQTRHPAPSLHHNRSSDTPQPYVSSPPNVVLSPRPSRIPVPSLSPAPQHSPMLSLGPTLSLSPTSSLSPTPVPMAKPKRKPKKDPWSRNSYKRRRQPNPLSTPTPSRFALSTPTYPVLTSPPPPQPSSTPPLPPSIPTLSLSRSLPPPSPSLAHPPHSPPPFPVHPTISPPPSHHTPPSSPPTTPTSAHPSPSLTTRATAIYNPNVPPHLFPTYAPDTPPHTPHPHPTTSIPESPTTKVPTLPHSCTMTLLPHSLPCAVLLRLMGPLTTTCHLPLSTPMSAISHPPYPTLPLQPPHLPRSPSTQLYLFSPIPRSPSCAVHTIAQTKQPPLDPNN